MLSTVSARPNITIWWIGLTLIRPEICELLYSKPVSWQNKIVKQYIWELAQFTVYECAESATAYFARDGIRQSIKRSLRFLEIQFTL
jgi:hypothetical protein